MDGKVFAYINEMVDKAAKKSGTVVNIRVSKDIYDKLVNSYPNDSLLEQNIIKGQYDSEIISILKNTYNLEVEVEEKNKPQEIKEEDFYRNIKSNMNVLDLQQKDLKAKEYIENYLKNSSLSKNDIKSIVKTILDNFSTEQILEGKANKNIDSLVEAYKIVYNSVHFEEQNMKQNAVVSKKKKQINRKDFLKKLLTFLLASAVSISIIYSVLKITGDINTEKEFNEYVSSLDDNYTNPLLEGKDLASTDLVTRFTTFGYDKDGNIITMYNTSEIARSMQNVINKDASLVGPMILYTYAHMKVDINTALKNMDIILKNIGIEENFITYIANNTELNEEEKEVVEKYNQNGYSSLTDKEKDTLKKFVSDYKASRVSIYEDFLDMKEGINGKGRS